MGVLSGKIHLVITMKAPLPNQSSSNNQRIIHAAAQPLTFRLDKSILARVELQRTVDGRALEMDPMSFSNVGHLKQ